MKPTPPPEMTDAERELFVAEEARKLDEGLDYFAHQGAADRRDLDRLSLIEKQREQAFDVPGVNLA